MVRAGACWVRSCTPWCCLGVVLSCCGCCSPDGVGRGRKAVADESRSPYIFPSSASATNDGGGAADERQERTTAVDEQGSRAGSRPPHLRGQLDSLRFDWVDFPFSSIGVVGSTSLDRDTHSSVDVVSLRSLRSLAQSIHLSESCSGIHLVQLLIASSRLRCNGGSTR